VEAPALISDAVLSLEETLELSEPTVGPTDPLPDNVEVLIVGAGPAGLTAALLLASYGLSTLVVEQNTTTSSHPKAVAVDDEFMRALDRIGVAERLKGHTSPPFGIRFLSPFGHPIVKVPGFVTPNGFGNRNAVSQPVLEKILLEAGRDAGVAFQFGTKLAKLSQNKDGVDVTVETDDGRSEFGAAFVIGCDGARSTVRQLLDIEFEGARINQPHLVIDLAEFPDQSPYSRFFCHPKRPLNSIPAPYGGRRVEFMLMPGDDPEKIIEPESIEGLFEHCTPYEKQELKIIRAAVYTFSQRIAGRFQVGRVFLAGDAAHTMPPFGAQGMNSGARDVSNLCWKLNAVLREGAAVSSLSSYEAERRPHVKSIVRYSVGIGRLTNLKARPLAFVRDAFFTLVNLIPPIRRWFGEMRYMPKPHFTEGLVVPEDSGKALVGRIFPRLPLILEDGTHASFDDLAANGHVIVGMGVESSQVRQSATQSPLQPVAAIALDWNKLPAGEDLVRGAQIASGPMPAAITRRLRRHRGQILLIRPDGYVALAAKPDRFASAMQRYNATLNG
jgi:3-(3-hydroxy-phenyl)propionate hydroxylase